MARQLKPALIGSVNLNEESRSSWRTLVWRLPNGGLRISGSKRNVVTNDADEGGDLKQMSFNEFAEMTGQRLDK